MGEAEVSKIKSYVSSGGIGSFSTKVIQVSDGTLIKQISRNFVLKL